MPATSIDREKTGRDEVTVRFIDVSHRIEHGMVTYRGLPGPVIRPFHDHGEPSESYADGVEFHIGRVDMVANTGTYLDAPFHRYRGEPDVGELALESVAGLPGVVVRAPASSDRAIGVEPFAGRDVAGKAVVVHTGWDRHWRTEGYCHGFPFLTAGAAAMLADGGAALVGIDSTNIDDDTDGRRPVHSTLLRAGTLVVEHLCNLAAVPDEDFVFFAVPAKMRGLGSFPVRAFAAVNER